MNKIIYRSSVVSFTPDVSYESLPTYILSPSRREKRRTIIESEWKMLLRVWTEPWWWWWIGSGRAVVKRTEGYGIKEIHKNLLSLRSFYNIFSERSTRTMANVILPRMWSVAVSKRCQIWRVNRSIISLSYLSTICNFISWHILTRRSYVRLIMSSKSSKYFSIRIARFLMKTVGFWYPETVKEKWIFDGILLYTLMAVTTSLVIVSLDVYYSWGDFYVSIIKKKKKKERIASSIQEEFKYHSWMISVKSNIFERSSSCETFIRRR